MNDVRTSSASLSIRSRTNPFCQETMLLPPPSRRNLAVCPVRMPKKRASRTHALFLESFPEVQSNYRRHRPRRESPGFPASRRPMPQGRRGLRAHTHSHTHIHTGRGHTHIHTQNKHMPRTSTRPHTHNKRTLDKVFSLARTRAHTHLDRLHALDGCAPQWSQSAL